MWWAKNSYAKTRIFSKNLRHDFTRKELCKSLYAGYNYFGLQNMCFKPNIPKPITCNGLSSLAHQEFSIEPIFFLVKKNIKNIWMK